MRDFLFIYGDYSPPPQKKIKIKNEFGRYKIVFHKHARVIAGDIIEQRWTVLILHADGAASYLSAVHVRLYCATIGLL